MKTHEDSNCFVLTVICHGNNKGHLLDRNKTKGWVLEDFIGDLSLVESLAGRPKLLVTKYHPFSISKILTFNLKHITGSSCNLIQLILTAFLQWRQKNFYHPRMRVGNNFTQVCLCVCVCVCQSVYSGYNFLKPL